VIQSEPLGAQMTRFLAAIVFTICVAAPSVRADSITYTDTEQFTKQTPTEENILWSFTGPQDFTLFDTLVPAHTGLIRSKSRASGYTSWRFTPGNQSPVSIAGLTFGTWGTFGHIEKRCWPNCPRDDAFK
jgi:hypothetical protein